MPVGCITAGPKSVARAMGAASLLWYYSHCRSATTSTVIQRYCTLLNCAISSTRALLFLLVNMTIKFRQFQKNHTCLTSYQTTSGAPIGDLIVAFYTDFMFRKSHERTAPNETELSTIQGLSESVRSKELSIAISSHKYCHSQVVSAVFNAF